jgi:HTH-type transcriptional regulator/antitoxin HigA
MANKQDLKFDPDYAVMPRETLRETLEALKMTPVGLAKASGLSLAIIEELIAGTATITARYAQALEKALSIPAEFWMNLERNYASRKSIARASTTKKRMRRSVIAPRKSIARAG